MFPVSARDVVGPDSARSIVAQSRSVVQFCGILSILAFSLHASSLFACFSSVPWLRSGALICARIPHDVSSHLAQGL